MIVTNDPGGEAVAAAREIAGLYAAMWRRFHSPKQRIVGSDVTPRMLGILRHLADAGPLTVGEQALHLGIGRATATELIDRLKAKGLVERMRDQRDQRRVFVWLTEGGRQRVVDLAGSPLDDPFVTAVAALPAQTRRQIIDGLGALLRAAGATVDDQEEKIS